jgi:hypothetical protein
MVMMVMRYMLALPTVEERYDMAQVKLYFRARNDSRHPLHISVKDTKGKRLKRGRSWMTRAEETIQTVYDLPNILEGREWVESENFKWNIVVRTLGRECRGWAQGRMETAVQQLIEEHSWRDDPIIYTDGSVTRWQRSGWAYSCRLENEYVLRRAVPTTRQHRA